MLFRVLCLVWCGVVCRMFWYGEFIVIWFVLLLWPVFLAICGDVCYLTKWCVVWCCVMYGCGVWFGHVSCGVL